MSTRPGRTLRWKQENLARKRGEHRYRIFLSHAFSDLAIVQQIKSDAEQLGIDVYIYEQDPRPGDVVSEKVREEIAYSDAVIALLSRSGAASAYVQQEIGVAIEKKKLVVPIVEDGVEPRQVAMLAGIEHLSFHRDRLGDLRKQLDACLRSRKQAYDADVAAKQMQGLGAVLLTVAVLLIVGGGKK